MQAENKALAQKYLSLSNILFGLIGLSAISVPVTFKAFSFNGLVIPLFLAMLMGIVGYKLGRIRRQLSIESYEDLNDLLGNGIKRDPAINPEYPHPQSIGVLYSFLAFAIFMVIMWLAFVIVY
jgi:hypothetical protein